MNIGDTYVWRSGRPKLGDIEVAIVSEPLVKVRHGHIGESPFRGEVYEWVKSPNGHHVEVQFQFTVKYRSGRSVTNTVTEVVPIAELQK